MTQSFIQQPQAAYQNTDYIEDYEDDQLYQHGTGYRDHHQNDGMVQYQDQPTFYQSPPNAYAEQSNSRPIQPASFNRTENNIFGLC